MSGCLAAIIVLFFILAISWGITCGILYLISLCFSLVFSWPIATGVWLALVLLSCLFKSSNSNKT